MGTTDWNVSPASSFRAGAVRLHPYTHCMQLLAELLYWIGRFDVLLPIVAFVHLVFVAIWHRSRSGNREVIGWSCVFAVATCLFWFLGIAQTFGGLDYTRHHLFTRVWSTPNEAMFNMLLRWQNILLPAYVPWLLFWVCGWLLTFRRMSLRALIVA
jgi:hypothetical protein